MERRDSRVLLELGKKKEPLRLTRERVTFWVTKFGRDPRLHVVFSWRGKGISPCFYCSGLTSMWRKKETAARQVCDDCVRLLFIEPREIWEKWDRKDGVWVMPEKVLEEVFEVSPSGTALPLWTDTLHETSDGNEDLSLDDDTGSYTEEEPSQISQDLYDDRWVTENEY